MTHPPACSEPRRRGSASFCAASFPLQHPDNHLTSPWQIFPRTHLNSLLEPRKQTQKGEPSVMEKTETRMNRAVNRRSFMKRGVLAGGAATAGIALLGGASRVFGQENESSPTKGDIAILRFLAAAELIESDLWTQYAELGGIGDNPPIEVDPGQTLNPYQSALSNLDPDGPQYIASNTLDEMSHAMFLNAYLESKGADPVSLKKFQNLQGSQVSTVANTGRLTNLLHLNVDTSWFIRYRSTTNPDFGATFPQAVTITNRAAIPGT